MTAQGALKLDGERTPAVDFEETETLASSVVAAETSAAETEERPGETTELVETIEVEVAAPDIAGAAPDIAAADSAAAAAAAAGSGLLRKLSRLRFLLATVERYA